MARVMIHSKNLAQHFLGEAVNIACHIINQVYLRPETNKPTVKYFRIFESKCFILRGQENLGKFEAKSDEGIFLGYSTTSRACRMFNKRTETVMKSINVVVDDEETESLSKGDISQPTDTSLESSSSVTGVVKPPSSPQNEQATPPQVTSP